MTTPDVLSGLSAAGEGVQPPVDETDALIPSAYSEFGRAAIALFYAENDHPWTVEASMRRGWEACRTYAMRGVFEGIRKAARDAMREEAALAAEAHPCRTVPELYASTNIAAAIRALPCD